MLEKLPIEILTIINQAIDYKDTLNLIKCSRQLYTNFQKLLFNSNFIVYCSLNSLPASIVGSEQRISPVTSEINTSTLFYDELELIVVKDISLVFSIFSTLIQKPHLINYIKSFKVHLVDLSNHNTNVHFPKSIGFKKQDNLIQSSTNYKPHSNSDYTIHKEGLDLVFDVSTHSFQIQTRNIKKILNFTLETLIQDHRQLNKSKHPKLFTTSSTKPKTKNMNETFDKRRKPVETHEDFRKKTAADSIILDLKNSLKRSFIFMPDDKTFPINDPCTLMHIEYVKQETLSQFNKILKLKVMNSSHNIINNWSFELVALNNAQIQSNVWSSHYFDDHEFEEGESRELSQLSLKSFGLNVLHLRNQIESKIIRPTPSIGPREVPLNIDHTYIREFESSHQNIMSYALKL